MIFFSQTMVFHGSLRLFLFAFVFASFIILPGYGYIVETPAEDADELRFSTLTGNKINALINSPNPMSPASRAAMAKVVDAYYAKFDLKNFVAVYGNVFTDEQYTYTKGAQQDGSAITPDHTFRWATMTKVVGALVAAKALDEGLFKLDDAISTYLPEFAVTNMKYVAPNATYDPSTGVVYGAELTTTVAITVRMLLNFNAGFWYGFFSWGDLQGMENGLAAYKYVLKTYGYPPTDASVVGYDYASSRTSTGNSNPSLNPNPLFTNNVNGLINFYRSVPLLYNPGTRNTGLSVYGPEMAIFGAFLTAVVRAKTGSAYYNAAQYAIDRIYKPLGIEKTSWFGYGDSPIPSGYNSAKLMDVSFVRNEMSYVGYRSIANSEYFPGVNLSLPNTDFESGKTANYGRQNTVLSNTSSPFHWPNYRGKSVFCKDVPDDSTCNFANSLVDTPYQLTSTYNGMFDQGGLGTWNDFAKILKLYVGKGVYNNQRIIGIGPMRFIQAPQIIGTASDYLTKLLEPFSAMPAADTPEYAAFVTPAISFCPINEGSPVATGMDWSFGACTADPRTGPVKFPLSVSYYSWVGYFNTNWFVDTETGVFAVYGSQSPKNAQWASMTGRNFCDDIESAIMSYRIDPIYVPWSNGVKY